MGDASTRMGDVLMRTINYEVQPRKEIRSTCRAAIKLAKAENCDVEFLFNDIKMRVSAATTPDRAVELYFHRLEQRKNEKARKEERDFVQSIKSPGDWLVSRHTGISSTCIFAFMIGATPSSLSRKTPSDPSDFGRCHRLLLCFPEWHARLSEMAQAVPDWAPLIREWDSLTLMYINHDGTSAMYKRMQQLIEEGRNHA